MKKYRVVGFLDDGVISVISHKEMSELRRNMQIIGSDYIRIEDAIIDGEKAWQENNSLNYRIETMEDKYGENEIIMVRHFDMGYTIYPEAEAEADDEFDRISEQMNKYSYIRENFSSDDA